MKVALLQLNPTVGDLASNAAHIQEAAEHAKTLGADIAVTSELSLVGYPPRDLLLQKDFVRHAQAHLQDLARSLPTDIAVLVGTIAPNNNEEGRPLFNTAAWLQHGQVEDYFHKRLLPTYDVFDEDRYFEPASTLNLKQYQGVTLGISVCEDIWNDQDFWQHRRYGIDPVEEMAAAGANIVLNLSASPFSMGKQQTRVQMMSAMTRKHSIPLVYVNQVGAMTIWYLTVQVVSSIRMAPSLLAQDRLSLMWWSWIWRIV